MRPCLDHPYRRDDQVPRPSGVRQYILGLGIHHEKGKKYTNGYHTARRCEDGREPKDVLACTAAYAAVLVVFVGAGGGTA